jgi:hypothetical protein
VREWRTRARLRKTLVDERTAWLQRVQATLFHHGDEMLRRFGGAPTYALTDNERTVTADHVCGIAIRTQRSWPPRATTG